MVKVYVWQGPIGHAGCQLTPNVYIGHHPSHKLLSFFDIKGDPKPSYEADKAAIGEKDGESKPADEIIEIPKLVGSTAYAENAWRHERSNINYQVLGSNCATMVATALKMCLHDYLSPRYGLRYADNALWELDYCKSVNWDKNASWLASLIPNPMELVWTPNDVFHLSTTIKVSLADL